MTITGTYDNLKDNSEYFRTLKIKPNMKKVSQSPLKIKGVYLPFALEVISGLYKIPRTGWVDRGVEHPETVGQHIDDLLEMADFFFPDCYGLKKMLKVHDWPEWEKKIGDRRTDKYCPEDHRYDPQEKKIAEREAMFDICQRLGPYGAIIFNLYLEYDAGITLRAQRANQLDKLQVDLKAVKYQIANQPVIAMQFIELNRHKIIIPELKLMLEEAELKLDKYLISKKIT